MDSKDVKSKGEAPPVAWKKETLLAHIKDVYCDWLCMYRPLLRLDMEGVKFVAEKMWVSVALPVKGRHSEFIKLILSTRKGSLCQVADTGQMYRGDGCVKDALASALTKASERYRAKETEDDDNKNWMTSSPPEPFVLVPFQGARVFNDWDAGGAQNMQKMLSYCRTFPSYGKEIALLRCVQFDSDVPIQYPEQYVQIDSHVYRIEPNGGKYVVTSCDPGLEPDDKQLVRAAGEFCRLRGVKLSQCDKPLTYALFGCVKNGPFPCKMDEKQKIPDRSGLVGNRQSSRQYDCKFDWYGKFSITSSDEDGRGILESDIPVVLDLFHGYMNRFPMAVVESGCSSTVAAAGFRTNKEAAEAGWSAPPSLP